MSAHERRKRIAALENHLKVIRPKFVHALQAMDYELALAFQKEIDLTQAELNSHRHHKSHARLMGRQRYDYYVLDSKEAAVLDSKEAAPLPKRP
jgi:hypothetical protein